MVAPGVDEELALGSDPHGGVAAAAGQAGEPAAVELHTVEVVGDGRVAGAGEIDPSALFVDDMQVVDLPLAGGDGPLQLAVAAEVIEMFPAAALAQEQERAVLQEVRWAGVLDPCLRRVSEQHSRSPPAATDGTEVEPRLGAVLDVVEDLPAIRAPADTDDQRGI